MRKNNILVPFLMICAVFWQGDLRAADAPMVTIVGDKWCPYSCNNSEENQGLLVDVVSQAFITRQMASKYTTTVWTRALRDVQQGHKDAILGVDADYIGNFFVYKDFYILDETVFITMRDSNIVINTGKDLANYRLGSVAEYSYDTSDKWKSFIEYHPDNLKVHSDQGEEKLLSLLLNERIDISVGNIDVTRMYLSKVGRLDDVKLHRKNLILKVYVGFSKTPRGEMLSREFAKGLQIIHKNGALEQIFEKYNVKMPNYALQPIQ